MGAPTAYAILGGYVLVGWSVAGMGSSMLLGGAPDASAGLSVGVTALACGGGVFAWFLYRPLFRPAPGPATTDPGSVGGQVAAA